jgi:SAM-dependent methyltransferase
MVQPGEFLQEARRVFTPNGRLLTSLPNIRYWDALMRSARDGDFPQEDSGIFDRTHLRFFTRRSIERFLQENGYEIERIKGLHPTPSRKLRMLNMLTRNRFEDCRYLQFLVLARPHQI